MFVSLRSVHYPFERLQVGPSPDKPFRRGSIMPPRPADGHPPPPWDGLPGTDSLGRTPWDGLPGTDSWGRSGDEPESHLIPTQSNDLPPCPGCPTRGRGARGDRGSLPDGSPFSPARPRGCLRRVLTRPSAITVLFPPFPRTSHERADCACDSNCRSPPSGTAAIMFAPG
jgi:hypothetical protein